MTQNTNWDNSADPVSDGVRSVSRALSETGLAAGMRCGTAFMGSEVLERQFDAALEAARLKPIAEVPHPRPLGNFLDDLALLCNRHGMNVESVSSSEDEARRVVRLTTTMSQRMFHLGCAARDVMGYSQRK